MNEQEQREQLAKELSRLGVYPIRVDAVADFILAREKGLRKTIDQLSMAKINDMWSKHEDIERTLTQQLATARKALENERNHCNKICDIVDEIVAKGGLFNSLSTSMEIKNRINGIPLPLTTPPQAASTEGVTLEKVREDWAASIEFANNLDKKAAIDSTARKEGDK